MGKKELLSIACPICKREWDAAEMQDEWWCGCGPNGIGISFDPDLPKPYVVEELAVSVVTTHPEAAETN